jgi:type IV pilus assembly protein PilC
MRATFDKSADSGAGSNLGGLLDEANNWNASAAGHGDHGDVEPLELTLFRRPVRRTDVIFFTTQLAVMIETGVSLSTALGGLIHQEENPTFRGVLQQLRHAVESGQDFSAALAKHPKLFDRTYVSLVKASEATGSLGEMLARIAEYLRRQHETISKVRASLTYPTVMLVMAIGVTVFLLTWVLPQFTPIFASRGVDLPKITRVLMVVSDALLKHWYWWLAGLAALITGLIYAKRTDKGQEVWDSIKINLPIIGPAVKKVIISRSIRTLGVMVEGGVSMLDALQLAADVSGNVHYERLWLHVLDQVTAGNEINEALSNDRLFPPTLRQMIASGEETGKLDMVLSQVSEFYDRQVEIALKTATSILEPLMIAVMGVIVGGIGMALLLPIFSLSRPMG